MSDRHPPLDTILETNTIIPRLIAFLDRFDSPSLQLEAAWSLTNFACGETAHIRHLLDNNALAKLVNVIMPTSECSFQMLIQM